jgi:hypothetical protein
MTRYQSCFQVLREREVKFRINLIHGSQPTSMSHYRLPWSFQEELKKQLDDLLAKVLI